jgi:protein phosphatase
MLGDRYRLLGPLTSSEATDLLGTPVLDTGDLFAVEDQRGHEQCWSCGSTRNEHRQRFCTDCGAPLQYHRSVLARTARPTGIPDEFSDGTTWFHPVRPRKQFDSTGVTIEVAGFSAEGPHHPNEDSYWSAVAGGCYDSTSAMVGVVALADGMGGYAPGSGLVSRDIVRCAGDFLFNHLYAEQETPLAENDLRALVKNAIQLANEQVLGLIAQSGEMGATLVLAAIFGKLAYIANIGDSRAYYVSPAGNVTRITRDQSLVEQQVAAGLLSDDAVYTAFGNNVILHAIGEPEVEQAFDWYVHPLEPGSRLLLCTDGYWKTMGRAVWTPEPEEGPPTLRARARQMVAQALDRTDDNTTVVLIGVE